MMGKGLSKQQKTILQALQEKGSLTIYDVDRILWEEKAKREKDYLLLKALRHFLEKGSEVKTIRNYPDLYRMMKSLVKKGLVGRILGVRPTIWVHLEDGKLSIKAIKNNPKILVKIRKNGTLPVQIGEKIRFFRLEGQS